MGREEEYCINKLYIKGKQSKESTSNNNTSSGHVCGPYNMKNDVKVAQLINLLQENEGMSIRVAAIIAILWLI